MSYIDLLDKYMGGAPPPRPSGRERSPFPQPSSMHKNLQAIRTEGVYEAPLMPDAMDSKTALSFHSEEPTSATAKSISRLRLGDDVSGVGSSVNWQNNNGSGNGSGSGSGSGAGASSSTSIVGSGVSSASVYQPHANYANTDAAAAHDTTPQQNERERITYQYALRYAMLLDAENAQLEARSRLSGSLDEIHLSSTPGYPPHDSHFSIRTVGQASGTPNTNNRTPTLIASPRDSKSPTEQGFHGRSHLRNRGWRSSILELSDSAARLIRKSENSGAGRLKHIAKNRLSGGDSTSPKDSPGGGGLTHGVVKAVTKQLKSATDASSIHPFTRACYSKMHSYLKVKHHDESLSEHGAIEDLLVIFADLSRQECSNQGINSSTDVSFTVNSQMDKFVKLLRSVLQKKAHTSREAGVALLRLDDYPDMELSGSGWSGRTRSHSDVHATLNASAPGAAPHSGQSASLASDSGSTCTWLKCAFNVPDHEHRLIMAELKNEVSQEQDQSFAGKPEDFTSHQAYQTWKQRETTLLGQLIDTYALKQNYMSGGQIGTGRSQRGSGISSELDASEIGPAFEYIPAHALSHYHLLVAKAIATDVIGRLGTADSRAVLQLSHTAEELLKQLATAWRVSAPYRAACHLDIIKDYYIEGALPASYLFEAFGKVERIIHLMKPHEWHVSQFNYMMDIQREIEIHALKQVDGVIREIDHHRPESTAALRRILRCLVVNDVRNPVVPNEAMPIIESRRYDTIAAIMTSIQYRYQSIRERYFSGQMPADARLDAYQQLAVLVLRDHDCSCKLFAEPILQDGDRRFDFTGILTEVETEFFYNDFKSYIEEFGYCSDNMNIEAALDLYDLLKRVDVVHAKYTTKKLEGIDARRLFKEAITLWLSQVDHEKIGWVENALKFDKVLDGPEAGKHSTSAIDLITCFSQQVSTIRRVSWPDNETKAWFFTHFMRLLDECFEQYAAHMERQFMSSLDLPLSKEETQRLSMISLHQSRKYKEQSLNLGAATQAAIERLDQSGVGRISNETCIRLNNLTIALDRLHEIQDELGIRELAHQLGGDSRPSLRSQATNKFLLSLKVVHAESLEIYKQQYDTSVDSSAKPYVKLAMVDQIDQHKTKRETFGKTRPALTNAMNPRWNQSFELELEADGCEIVAPIEVRVCTRDGPKKLGHREKTHARGFIALSSKMAMGIDGTLDVVLDLEPRGFLLMRITVDGEREDMEFYSGRMFRCLEHTLSDLQQCIVEQVSVGAREYLRQILVANSSRYRSSRMMGIDHGIERSIQFLKHGGHHAPASVRVTQESCFEALIPLIDFLEDNLHTLFIYLYEDTAFGVICKVWKEILCSIEDILLPPLRGASKGSAKPLTESDINNIFESIQFLKWYFEGGSDKDGIPSETLMNRKYRELYAVRDMYFMTSKELMDAYVDELHKSASESSSEASSTFRPADDPASKYSRPLPPIPVGSSTPANSQQAPAFKQSSGSSASAEPRSPRDKRPVPAPPFRGNNINTSSNGSKKGIYEDSAFDSSNDDLPTPTQEIRAAVLPVPATNTPLARSRSVWGHKDAETSDRLKRKYRMVTDKGDVILRLLRLRYDKEAAKFVQAQLDIRSQQMHFEMRRAVRKSHNFS
ncbi:hypothetical protein GGI12_001643 [Dipsacomyces acuminosporus]|nr:hypothetical protein GGI12_001643 [Dipsacomyces acuminosporus]